MRQKLRYRSLYKDQIIHEKGGRTGPPRSQRGTIMHRDRTADKATAKLRLDEMEPVKRLLLLPRITLRHWGRKYELPPHTHRTEHQA